MAEVRFDRIEKLYGRIHAVRPVELTVRDGEFLVLLGPSGCGKTTMLRMVAGQIGRASCRERVYCEV